MKTILITGSTDGIGKIAASLLLRMGLRVVLHARSADKLGQVLSDLQVISGMPIPIGVVGDFTRLEDVEGIVDQLREKNVLPDVLINNAAVFKHERNILSSGFEETFQVNYLSPYFLTRLILSLAASIDGMRVVNVASMAQSGSIDFNNLMGEKRFDGYEAYALSKLANVLFTYKLHREYASSGLAAVCLHPGVINTKLLQSGWGAGGSSTLLGAQRIVYAATHALDNEIIGKYLVNNLSARSVALSYDQRVQDVLWNKSASLLGLSG